MSEERITFNCGDLKLEGIIAIPEGKSPFPAVVLCHPHPLYGGDMYDSVISTIAQALLNKGIAAFRFNFRGVGESQGNYGGGKNEQDDTVAAIDYITKRNDIVSDKIGLTGYSFGGGVAFNVALKDDKVNALALVSPVIPDSGWKRLSTYSKPKLLVLGNNDEYFPLVKYEPKIKNALKTHEYAIFPATDHFWTTNKVIMAERLAEFFAAILI
jgi:hypothetical protein